MAIQLLDANQARSKWRDIMDAAQSGQADTVIERYGKPLAVVIPYQDYMALQEELEDLRLGRLAQTEFEAWEKDPSTGRPWEEIKAEMIEEGLLSE